MNDPDSGDWLSGTESNKNGQTRMLDVQEKGGEWICSSVTIFCPDLVSAGGQH